MGLKITWIKTEKKVREFSKNFVVALTFLWFVGAVFGGVIVWREPTNLSYLLEYIGAPMVGGVLGYLLKSAFENREKIRKSTKTTPEDDPHSPGN